MRCSTVAYEGCMINKTLFKRHILVKIIAWFYAKEKEPVNKEKTMIRGRD